MTTLQTGDRAGRIVSQRLAAPLASLAAMKAIGPRFRSADQLVMTTDEGKLWRFAAASTLTGDDQLIATPGDAPSAGRWLLMPGAWRLRLPIAFGTADATALYTLPTGASFFIGRPYWSVTADFTGGASSAIGLSSAAKSGLTAKGALLGGASGDVAATLTAAGSPAVGTVGSGWDTLAKRDAIWVPGDVVRFDRITSAFAAGSGFAVLPVQLLKNDGA